MISSPVQIFSHLSLSVRKVSPLSATFDTVDCPLLLFLGILLLFFPFSPSWRGRRLRVRIRGKETYKLQALVSGDGEIFDYVGWRVETGRKNVFQGGVDHRN
ncbi:hypothetical protein F7725_022657 [Dissostichus mawsoni]|uniref:Uncharacterized protein n=1 Tax=Dissostichus mawsoni TaxID=36200 RepID=A0A7J5YYE4_DISMA|nr:hypothetical protein F7725_022657 [Dissostichus mawsoni]